MNEPNQAAITTYKPMPLVPRTKQPLFERREEYPILLNESGEERIILPLKDYRKFRGETSHWQFISLVLLGGVLLITWAALTTPPIYVKEPFVVEKVVPTPVPTKCLFFCK